MRFFRLASIIVLCFASIIQASAVPVKGMRDVPKSHWATPAIQKLVEEYHFMQGDPNGNFAGSRAISRYEFARTMANIVDHYNTELEQDRKDLANVVEVMELFQKELKTLEGKISEADKYVQNQNQSLGELNELVVGLSDVVNTGSGTASSQIGLSVPAANPNDLEKRVAELEEKIATINDRGLIIGTVLRGVAKDMKHITKAAGTVVTGGRAWRKPKPQDEDKVKIFEFVDATIQNHPENNIDSAKSETNSTSPSVIEEQNHSDGSH